MSHRRSKRSKISYKDVGSDVEDDDDDFTLTPKLTNIKKNDKKKNKDKSKPTPQKKEKLNECTIVDKPKNIASKPESTGTAAAQTESVVTPKTRNDKPRDSNIGDNLSKPLKENKPTLLRSPPSALKKRILPALDSKKILSSPEINSPRTLRLGLSRNVKLPPLHKKFANI